MIVKQKKIYVLDTSVLMHDADCIKALGDNEIVIPGPVLQELSDLLHDHDERKKYLARIATRVIESYDERGQLGSQEGVPTENNGTLRIEVRSVQSRKLPAGYNPTQGDNLILMVALWIAEQQKSRRKEDKKKVVLITKDRNLRQRAKALQPVGIIDAEDYESDKIEDFMPALYGAIAEITLPEGYESTLSLLHRQNMLALSDIGPLIDTDQMKRLHENQCVFLRLPNGKFAQTIFKKERGLFRIVKSRKSYDRSDELIPRNDLQAFALGLLDDTDIGIVTLVGIAGAGKTLLALKWAYDNLGKSTGNGGDFEKIIVFRSNTEAGRQLGFLPGDLSEKFNPWKAPVYTAFDFLTRHRVRDKGDGVHKQKEGEPNGIVEHLESMGKLAVMPPNFTRGATYHNSIIIIDDAQNLPMKLMQLLITRAGENSRVIITGDPTQIDDPHLDAASCGLIQAAIRFRDNPMCASIFLPASERSQIAELAAQLLN